MERGGGDEVRSRWGEEVWVWMD